MLGRDPVKDPLRPIELAIFAECLRDQWEERVKATHGGGSDSGDED